VIDVTIIQSLVRNGAVDNRVADYGHVFVDECHHVSAHSFEAVIRRPRLALCSACLRLLRARTATTRSSPYSVVRSRIGWTPGPRRRGGRPVDLTALLEAWNHGDLEARDQLIPAVYAELRRRAAAFLRRERAGQTLQPTALVHEGDLRDADGTPLSGPLPDTELRLCEIARVNGAAGLQTAGCGPT
jgi:hypothetical protein